MTTLLALLTLLCTPWSGHAPPLSAPAAPTSLDSLVLAVELHRANIFYAGLDNHFSVVAQGSEAQDLEVRCAGSCAIQSAGGHDYVARCNQLGRAILTICDKNTGHTTHRTYRIKRLPAPTTMLGRYTYDATLPAAEFRAQRGLVAAMLNMDMHARCKMVSYTLYYQPKNRDALVLTSTGSRFTGAVADAVKQAQPGDRYVFADVKARCPGDPVGRPMNGLSFVIR